MTDRLIPLPINQLAQWIFSEYESQETIFGIHKSLFFKPKSSDFLQTTRYGQLLETPIGAAAGPHTQLAQNIVSAWLCGARFLELKTVQTLDELEISRPCIDITDEGYNCEWSQELKVNESFDEYLKAWILIHMLKDKLDLGSSEDAGFIFNISVGYDFNGIQNQNVQNFLNKMTECSNECEKYYKLLEPKFPRVRGLNISPKISNNVTLSTMHGCPPEEIEKIATYFITERKFHTTVKLNPTLLGKKRVREIVNENLGFKITIPDDAFEHDLRYHEGLEMIRSLQQISKKEALKFSVKLTNTLEVINKNTDLPNNEKTIYLSGRALHPIAINLAAKLQSDFQGKLDISFCGGVDAFNISKTLECGLSPVTVCSDLLKPGGYARLAQYISEIRNNPSKFQNNTTLQSLQNYAGAVLDNPRYKKPDFPFQNIKTATPLPVFDCAVAPCQETCSTDQDVPGYMDFVKQGDLQNAFKTVLDANPFPNSTGEVCDKACEPKCTRINYDSPLKIREMKRFIAENASPDRLKLVQKNNQSPILDPKGKIAIIGAGPAGLSCAYFLLENAFEVEIFEQTTKSGGMIASMIPDFRLNEKSIQLDIDMIVNLGAKLYFETEIDKVKFGELQNNFDFIFIGTGAQKSRKLGMPGENSNGVYDQLVFLSKLKSGESVDLGNSVAIIGGGNSAMDAARAAKRIAKSVTVIYRRTKKEMPAIPDEIHELLNEGIIILELALPEKIIKEKDKVTGLICLKMKLGEPDESGRKRPIKIQHSEFELPFDSIITAIGQEVTLDFFPASKLQIDHTTQETQIENVFAGGDSARGASSLVNAIGDGKRAAFEILKRQNLIIKSDKSARTKLLLAESQQMMATRIMPDKVKKLENLEDAQKEAKRCLQCDQICNVCVSVCPNRANIFFTIEPSECEFPIYQIRNRELQQIENFRIEQKFQIVNIADFCNDCGNCDTFCPTAGAPYVDKAIFHLNETSFSEAEEGFFFKEKSLLWKSGKKMATLENDSNCLKFEDEKISAQFDPETLKIQNYHLKNDEKDCDLQQVITMAIFIKNLNLRFCYD